MELKIFVSFRKQKPWIYFESIDVGVNLLQMFWKAWLLRLSYLDTGYNMGR